MSAVIIILPVVKIETYDMDGLAHAVETAPAPPPAEPASVDLAKVVKFPRSPRQGGNPD